MSRLKGDEDIAIGTNSEVDGQRFVLRLPVASKEAFSELATKAQPVSVKRIFVVSWNVLTYRRTLQIVRMILCLLQERPLTSEVQEFVPVCGFPDTAV
jgi:hypothetical protein